MKRCYLFLLLLLVLVLAPVAAYARDANLVRYPHYHQGRVAFTYLGDIWTADENSQNIHRITANKAWLEILKRHNG